MAQAECARGHIYDSDVYPSCPYCNGERVSFAFGKAGSADIGKTGAVLSPGGSDAASRLVPGSTTAGSDIGKTHVPTGENSGNKTSFVFESRNKLDPVVGWLVCIEGADKGKDFHLYPRKNFIGRGERMDVSLKDKSISTDIHAQIAYDDMHNEFYFISGEKSRNTDYLNDIPVYSQAKLSGYDVLRMGTSKFMFVPFCCDKFEWSDEQTAGEEK